MSKYREGQVVRILRGECSGNIGPVVHANGSVVVVSIGNSGREAYCLEDDVEKEELNPCVEVAPVEREDQREYERKSPRSTVNQLAEQWQNGPEEARSRLWEMLANGERFDARDRAALAYLVMKEWK